jgi:pSer/pThr/pTyr-binding forkhead associated (FHA) protein
MLEVYLQNLSGTDGTEDDLGCGIAVSRFPFVIGRRPECDHTIRHKMISRQQCSFFVDHEEVWVIDLHGGINHASPFSKSRRNHSHQ